MEQRVDSLEKRMGKVEQSLAKVEATQEHQGREIQGIRSHLNRMDDERITPMAKQLQSVHNFCSRAEGIQIGRADVSNNFWKILAVVIAGGGLVITILTVL